MTYFLGNRTQCCKASKLCRLHYIACMHFEDKNPQHSKQQRSAPAIHNKQQPCLPAPNAEAIVLRPARARPSSSEVLLHSTAAAAIQSGCQTSAPTSSAQQHTPYSFQRNKWYCNYIRASKSSVGNVTQFCTVGEEKYHFCVRSHDSDSDSLTDESDGESRPDQSPTTARAARAAPAHHQPPPSPQRRQFRTCMECPPRCVPAALIALIRRRAACAYDGSAGSAVPVRRRCGSGRRAAPAGGGLQRRRWRRAVCAHCAAACRSAGLTGSVNGGCSVDCLRSSWVRQASGRQVGDGRMVSVRLPGLLLR